MKHRYEPMLARDESWLVFDVLLSMPAEIDGRCLIGLGAGDCGELARRMNGQEASINKEVRPWRN